MGAETYEVSASFIGGRRPTLHSCPMVFTAKWPERECVLDAEQTWDHLYMIRSLSFLLFAPYLIVPLFAQPILPPMMLVDLSLTTYEFLTPDGQSASIQAQCDVVKVKQARERCSNRCKRVVRYFSHRLAKTEDTAH